MNNCCTNKKYDFCTVAEHTVFTKKFKISLATAEWEFEFSIYKPDNTVPVEVWNVANGKLEREDDQTWVIPQHVETLNVGEYIYTACYKIGTVDRLAFRGNITVKNHN